MQANNQNIEELTFSDILGDRFGRYSKYIIQDRALPDIRDGLKPVQRRILYAMYEDRNTADNPYRKSAKTVGNVIGNFHPHGDSSVYEAMVRMSQDWKNRQPLIDMHGNNGSMDGDPAAAMRYTEARLSKIAMELLRDIHMDTVDYALNFDDSLEEPMVLPARFPNLLVNGATGISAGYATEIPPHNLGEVIDAAVYMLSHDTYTLADIMKFIKGPDFPTGTILQGAKGLKAIYKSGHGKIVLRSTSTIESLKGGKSQIVITELPYEVNKSKLIQRIDDIRIQRKVEGMADVRDESDRNGTRLVIEIKREADAEQILNYLFKNTDLQINYHFNMIAINQRRPHEVGLIDMLEAYIAHQKEVILRRTQYSLNKDQARLHIVDGLIYMVSILDQVIATIRQSESKSHAKENLAKEFDFSLDQAEAIVSLQLYRLTNTDIVALQNERLELNERIGMYHNILSKDKSLKATLINELKAVKKAFPSPRRTQIEVEIEEINIEQSLLVNEEQVMVTVTKEGYIKRTSLRSFATSDTMDLGVRELDYVIFAQELSTYQALVLITNKGQYIHLPVHELPDIRWKDLGMHLSQQYNLTDGEQVVFVSPASRDINDQELAEYKDQYLVMATKEGMIKKTPLTDFVSYRTYKSRPSQAMKMKTETDEIIGVAAVKQDTVAQVILLTEKSYSLRYPLTEVSEYGLKAQGVTAINLKKDDYLAAFLLDNQGMESQAQIILMTQRGNIKRFDNQIIADASRGSRGILMLKELKNNPHRVLSAALIQDLDQMLEVTGDTGFVVTIQARQVPKSDRLANGSSLDQLDKLGQVLVLRQSPLLLLEEA
ncbi:DNA topoisomerase IV subunit A [Eremococcus coleocola]|uniref:DNA topoisomerase IV subunit A n=1 Tax=Eremococcus coleocola TaxID=88132 RepID=UPI00041FBAFC|nr:DNA topoisomerase IV subunit A [Eremococcus coleocola]